MAIDFIYFDVGGVVIKDFSKTNKWEEMLDDLGLFGVERTQFEAVFEEEEPKFCRGKDVDNLIPILRDEFGVHLEFGYSLLEDFVSRFERNEALSEIISDLEDDIEMGLLTNMYEHMLVSIRQHGLLPDIKWNVIIDSSVIGHIKPEPEIFELAQKKAGVDPDKILFVENSPMHIEGAKKAGWQTLLYDPSDIEGSNFQLKQLLNI